MKRKHLLWGACFFYLMGLVPGPVTYGANENAKSGFLSERLNNLFSDFDQKLSRAAQDLTTAGGSSSAARQVLVQLCGSVAHSIDCSWVDREGKLAVVEPAQYSEHEGTDISQQEQVVKIMETKRPVLSGVFKSVEGIEAIDLEYPLFSMQKEFLGSVSLLVDHKALFDILLGEPVKGWRDDLLILQSDGTVVYSNNPSYVAKNIFSDEVFEVLPDFIGLGRMILEQSDGMGNAKFPDRVTGQLEERIFVWSSFEFYDQTWRVVVIRNLRGGV